MVPESEAGEVRPARCKAEGRPWPMRNSRRPRQVKTRTVPVRAEDRAPQPLKMGLNIVDDPQENRWRSWTLTLDGWVPVTCGSRVASV